MHKITFISTIHKEYGKCNSDELCSIIESIKPEVIFLEALEDSYSPYAIMLLSYFGVYNDRLELKTIQKYNENYTFEYVPVLDMGLLSDEFDTKAKIVSENIEYQRLLDNFNSLEKEGGFPFLNSEKSILLQEEMRELENRIIDNDLMHQKVNASIDDYENSMIRNIYSFCKENSFNTAVFMCGAAHRKSIIEKIEAYEKNSDLKLNWDYYI